MLDLKTRMIKSSDLLSDSTGNKENNTRKKEMISVAILQTPKEKPWGTANSCMYVILTAQMRGTNFLRQPFKGNLRKNRYIKQSDAY